MGIQERSGTTNPGVVGWPPTQRVLKRVREDIPEFLSPHSVLGSRRLTSFDATPEEGVRKKEGIIFPPEVVWHQTTPGVVDL